MTWNARYRKLEKRLPHDLLAVDELSQLLSEARAELLKLISENDDAQPSEALAVDRAAARVRSLRDKPPSSLEGLGIRECQELCSLIDRRIASAGQRKGLQENNRSRSLVAEQKKKISVSFFRDCIGKNPKLSRAAVHRLLKKKWASLTPDPELPLPCLSSFKKYCKGLKN
jgi:hypothetical protein